MPTLNLLYKRQYSIHNDKNEKDINIIIPTVGEIMDDEENYYGVVSMLTSMPIDMMLPLHNAGIDFTEINEYDLFLLLFPGIQQSDTSLIFQDLDLSKFVLLNEPDGSFVLYDKENGITIDRAIHGQIANVLRKIHHLEKNRKKPANEDAKEYLLKRARQKASRKKRTHESQLENLIVAMVNTEQYKYGFEETRNLTIYQFNESVRQVMKKVDYDGKIYGIYAGTVDPKKMNPEDLNWLSHK